MVVLPLSWNAVSFRFENSLGTSGSKFKGSFAKNTKQQQTPHNTVTGKDDNLRANSKFIVGTLDDKMNFIQQRTFEVEVFCAMYFMLNQLLSFRTVTI